MCRRAEICTELGADPATWPTQSPLPVKPWFDESMHAFVQAFGAAVAGDLDEAERWLARTHGPELVEWFDVHAQNAGTFRARHYGHEPRPDDVVLDPVRSVTRFEPAVMSRDGYRCRYCGLRVLPKATLRRFREAVEPGVFVTTGTNRERHGIRMAFSATVDHVVPHSRGGRTDLDNLVTACWACNYGKSNYTLAELGMDDPRDRAPVLTTWHGLHDQSYAARAGSSASHLGSLITHPGDKST